jgi:hypothetical protein
MLAWYMYVMPKVISDTPLAKVLRSLGVTQDALAARLGLRQGSLSRLVRRVSRPKHASRILDAIDPERQVLDELHLLYPERYPDFTADTALGLLGRPSWAPEPTPRDPPASQAAGAPRAP